MAQAGLEVSSRIADADETLVQIEQVRAFGRGRTRAGCDRDCDRGCGRGLERSLATCGDEEDD